MLQYNMQMVKYLHYELGCTTMDVFVHNKTYVSKIFYCPQQQEI